MPRKRHANTDQFVTNEFDYQAFEYSNLRDVKLDDGRVYGFEGDVRTRRGNVEVRYHHPLRWDGKTEHLRPEQGGWISVQLGSRIFVRHEERPASRALTKRGAVIVARRWVRDLAKELGLS